MLDDVRNTKRGEKGKFVPTGHGFARKPVCFKVTQEMRDWIDSNNIDVATLLRGYLQQVMSGQAIAGDTNTSQIDLQALRKAIADRFPPRQRQAFLDRFDAAIETLK